MTATFTPYSHLWHIQCTVVANHLQLDPVTAGGVAIRLCNNERKAWQFWDCLLGHCLSITMALGGGVANVRILCYFACVHCICMC